MLDNKKASFIPCGSGTPHLVRQNCDWSFSCSCAMQISLPWGLSAPRNSLFPRGNASTSLLCPGTSFPMTCRNTVFQDFHLLSNFIRIKQIWRAGWVSETKRVCGPLQMSYSSLPSGNQVKNQSSDITVCGH